MSRTSKSLPDFDRPPVAEVVAGVQFEPLGLPPVWLGQWFDKIKDRFPHVEEKQPLPSQIETFQKEPTAPRVDVRIVSEHPKPRIWFLDKPNGTELLQVQDDRLLFNWRGHVSEDACYPRYDYVRERFTGIYSEFETFVAKNFEREIRPLQCELTYVNYFLHGREWTNLADLPKLLSIFRDIDAVGPSQEFEAGKTALAYLIRDDAGAPYARLRVEVENRFFLKNKEPLIQLDLHVRGAPSSATTDGIVEFLDAAHEIIVRKFAAITTEQMHKQWGRTDA